VIIHDSGNTPGLRIICKYLKKWFLLQVGDSKAKQVVGLLRQAADQTTQKYRVFLGGEGGGQQPLLPLLLLDPPFFSTILFGSTTLLTRMTGNSWHMQWPLFLALFSCDLFRALKQFILAWHETSCAGANPTTSEFTAL
jgi:hypothetical protein